MDQEERVERILRKGWAFVEGGQRDKALECFREAIRLDEENPGLWLEKGVALFKLEMWDEAARSFGKAIDLDPGQLGSWMQWYNRANVTTRNGFSIRTREGETVGIFYSPTHSIWVQMGEGNQVQVSLPRQIEKATK